MEAKRVCVPSINFPNKQRTANASFFFFLANPLHVIMSYKKDKSAMEG